MATTVESLLSSLQVHLTSQTPIIPSLHAQLGLPPTALTEDLAELHAALVDCVDKKIEERKRQVSEWMEKCVALENESLGFAKALGSHAKVIAGSVGELRKQQVLPKRFDYLVSYRDKLQNLYKTKFEQCAGLIAKVNALVRVAGPRFFPSDVLSMAETKSEEESKPLADITPERFSRLEKELVRAKGEIARRLAQLSQTFLQIGWLYEELGISLSSSSDDNPMLLPNSPLSSSVSDPFLSASCSLNGIISSKTNDDTLASYNAIFSRFVARLQEANDESLDIAGPGNEIFGVERVEPTPGLMKWAESTKTRLEELKSRREAHIQGLYNELENLWRRLGVTEEEMDAFVEMNRGSTDANVQAYEAEYERMVELKRESMSIFIANARVEIERLWDEIILGEEERGAFAPFGDDEHTEELLALHEKEIIRLKEERRIKAPILAAVKKYYELCEDEKELAASASDQSRLLGRGPRDPGRLLREEKMRKRVSKEKPRLEKELLVAVPAWEAEYRRPFLVNSVSILEVLKETVYAVESEKENRKRHRPGSVPPRGTTPQPTVVRPGMTITPGSYHNDDYGGGPKSAPNKKPRLGPSNVLNGGLSNNPGSSPHKYHPTQPAKTTNSSLPRPISHSKSTLHAHGYGMGRIPSTASTLSSAGFTSLFGGSKSGNKRESFKPRPSVDGPGPALDGGRGHWGGFAAGMLKEEPEY